MCWSWEVSLCFVIFQLISFVYLWRRNKYIDRWYVMVCAPFMGQELCQFFEWAWGDIENATHYECNAFNTAWSKILILDAFSIPLIIAIFAYKTSQYSKREDPKTAFMWKFILILDIILYPILSIFLMLDKECITVGDNGHQHWPPITSSTIIDDNIGDAFGVFLIGIYYYPSIILVDIFYKPLWVSILPAFYSILSLVLLLIFIGSEAWSVWCWSCACITLWGFFYVPISRWMIKKYENERTKTVDSVFGDNCLSRCLMSKTHEHMVRYEMLTRVQATKTDEEEQRAINVGDL